MEGTSVCHLVQPLLLKQGDLEQADHDHVQMAFDTVKYINNINIF